MPTLSEPSYRNINAELHTAYQSAALMSMSNAAKTALNNSIDDNSLKNQSGETIGLCRVSLDGTWQKRGHASLNGVVSACNDGKCVDIHVMSKNCNQCKTKKESLSENEFETWKESHTCNVNHDKSSGTMEGAGAVAMFNRSVERYNLIYHEYLGDGDTSSYKEVVDSKPYADYDITPEKLERVGHVKKRLGTRLRNKIKEYKGTATSLSGRGKLTESIINSLQNFYGKAIRENTNQLYLMKESVGAILWHCTQFDDLNFRHRFCPEGRESWCSYKKDQATGEKTYVSNINLPKWNHDIIKPVFLNLSDNVLLSKCLHGETQNVNEGLNQIIWLKCPKAIYVERPTLEIGVYSAVLQYNEGAQGFIPVLKHFEFSSGLYFNQGVLHRNNVSIRTSQQKDSDTGKKRRKALRRRKKGFIDKEKESETIEPYVSGGH